MDAQAFPPMTMLINPAVTHANSLKDVDDSADKDIVTGFNDALCRNKYLPSPPEYDDTIDIDKWCEALFAPNQWWKTTNF